MELNKSDPSGEHALNDIRSVQTIHAVGPHDSRLLLYDLTSLTSVWLIKSIRQLCPEPPKPNQFLIKNSQKFWKIFKLKSLAFMMEIKPFVGQLVVLQRLKDFCELFANSVLGALLVN